jgi:hypothetical protein
MEWLATLAAFSRDRAIPNGNSAFLAHWTGARGQLRQRLTAISDLKVWPEVAGLRPRDLKASGLLVVDRSSTPMHSSQLD